MSVVINRSLMPAGTAVSKLLLPPKSLRNSQREITKFEMPALKARFRRRSDRLDCAAADTLAKRRRICIISDGSGNQHCEKHLVAGRAETINPVERLSALLHAYADFAVRNPDTYRLSFMEDPKFTEEIFCNAPLETEDGAGRQAFAALVKVVRELKQNGKLAAEADENLIAEMFWTSVHGVVSLKVIYPAFPTNSVETLINKMVKTLINGLQIE